MDKKLFRCLLLLVLLAFYGCDSKENELLKEDELSTSCCQQCTQAASQDPAGMDISGKDCRGYDEKLTKRCVKYFEANAKKVEECSLLAK